MAVARKRWPTRGDACAAAAEGAPRCIEPPRHRAVTYVTAKDQPELLVRGFGIFAIVTDLRPITATNTGQFDFRIVFEDGVTAQSFLIHAGSTLAFTVPTVEFSSYIGIAAHLVTNMVEHLARSRST